VLNNLATLLAFVDYRMLIATDDISLREHDVRVEKAKTCAQELLLAWNVKRTVQVGFEMIMKSLLVRLESFGICFESPALAQLDVIYQAKIQRFALEEIYSPR
jgi:hypothetical protein